MALDELTVLVNRAKNLLDDPQPGLFTWCTALADTLTELSKKWTKGEVK